MFRLVSYPVAVLFFQLIERPLAPQRRDDPIAALQQAFG